MCHLNLEVVNKILQPMLNEKTLLVNVWGGGGRGSNFTNIGKVCVQAYLSISGKIVVTFIMLSKLWRSYE